MSPDLEGPGPRPDRCLLVSDDYKRLYLLNLTCWFESKTCDGRPCFPFFVCVVCARVYLHAVCEGPMLISGILLGHSSTLLTKEE